MSVKKIDATMLAKAKFDYVKDLEKLNGYDLVPPNHGGDRDITPKDIATAAQLRHEEYGKPLAGYVKELEIAVDKFTKHTARDIIESNYKRYEAFDNAVEASQAEDPFSAILVA